MNAKLRALFADDEPALSPDQVDIFLNDGGAISKSQGPRQNKERPRVQWHDHRGAREKQADPRTAREIILELRAQR